MNDFNKLSPFHITEEQENKELKRYFYCECGVQLSRPRYNSLCFKCQEKLNNDKKRKWLADRKYTMSIEERIAEIEKWMYEHKQNHPNREVLFK